MQKKLMFVRAIFVLLVLLALMAPTVALACDNDPPQPHNAYQFIYQNDPGPYHDGAKYENAYQDGNSYNYSHCNGMACAPDPWP